MGKRKNENRFIANNIITIFGEVDQQMINHVKKSFDYFYQKGSPDVIVLISSTGGSGSIALDICDIFQLYPGKTTAIVVDNAYSAAGIILQGCSERLATPNSLILVHNGAMTINIDVLRDEVKFKAEMKRIEKFTQRMYDIFMKKSGHSLQEIKDEFLKDKTMDVKDAISFKLLDDIWDKPLPK
jgi:ATP-dependent protease ClpP protease subunit